MKIRRLVIGLSLATSALIGIGNQAFAAEVLCKVTTNNHTYVDDSYVKSCINAGVGNIGQGNQAQDDFLNTQPIVDGLYGGYTSLGDTVVSFTKPDPLGTFSFDPALWNNADQLFLGLKFGTGNTPDEWMVYELQANVSSGTWRFVDVLAPGNDINFRLSHMALYSKGDGGGSGDELPEPASLALVGIGLLGAALTRRRKRLSSQA